MKYHELFSKRRENTRQLRFSENHVRAGEACSSLECVFKELQFSINTSERKSRSICVLCYACESFWTWICLSLWQHETRQINRVKLLC